MERSMIKRLVEAIRSFGKIKIMVIGDIILDEYIWGEVSRISPEAPVPVVHVKEESRMLGGAANVVHNILSLGAKASLYGVAGQDASWQSLKNLFQDIGVRTEGILQLTDRPTTVKTRIIARSQQVVRFDREDTRPLPWEIQSELLLRIENDLDSVQGVIISDYKKGVINKPFVERLMAIIKGKGRDQIFVAVDPKTGNFHSYEGVDILTPNQQEAESFCNFELRDQESLRRAYELFREKLSIRYLLITQGAHGMTLFDGDGKMVHIPTAARKVFDVTGAGDTVISTFTLGYLAGLSLVDAAVLSNLAAGIVVGEVGTSVVKAKELIKVIRGFKPSSPYLS